MGGQGADRIEATYNACIRRGGEGEENLAGGVSHTSLASAVDDNRFFCGGGTSVCLGCAGWRRISPVRRTGRVAVEGNGLEGPSCGDTMRAGRAGAAAPWSAHMDTASPMSAAVPTLGLR